MHGNIPHHHQKDSSGPYFAIKDVVLCSRDVQAWRAMIQSTMSVRKTQPLTHQKVVSR